MNEKTIFILFVFFVFIVFLLNNFGISGRSVIGVSHRFCIDSDNGINVNVPGYVESDLGIFYDRCLIAEAYVSEFYSNGTPLVGGVIGPRKMSVREYYCGEGRHGGNYQVHSKIIQCDQICERDVEGSADACV